MQEHRFITLERIFKNGFVNFGRNIYLSVAAVAMMAVTLTILMFAVIANKTFGHTIDEFNSRIDVTMTLKDTVTDTQLQQLTQEAQALPNVKSVQYISKTDALKDYNQHFANSPQLLTAIAETGNVLHASLILKPVDPYKIQSLRDFTNQPDIKAETVQSLTDTTTIKEDAVNNITSATHLFQKAGVIGIIVFALVSIMIIFNTIRMAIFNRRDELVIMRLLGATTSFIRGPFVVESVLYGVVAALISIGVVALSGIAVSSLHADSFGYLDISYAKQYFTAHWLPILGIQLAAGIIIGAVSSAIATRRYLKINR